MNESSIPSFILHQEPSIGWSNVSGQHFKDGGFPSPIHTKQTKALDYEGERPTVSANNVFIEKSDALETRAFQCKM